MADNLDTSSIFDYGNVGFDAFLSRSIDLSGLGYYPTLNTIPAINTGMQVNYDQNQISGALGDSLRIGNIAIDGANGRISIYDDGGNEIVRLGAL